MPVKGTQRVVFLFGILALALALSWKWAPLGERQEDSRLATSISDLNSSASPHIRRGDDSNTNVDRQEGVVERGRGPAKDDSVLREGVELNLTIELVDPQGVPVEGQVLLLARTAELEERLNSGRYAGSYLFEDSLLAEAQSTQGIVALSVRIKWSDTPLVALAIAAGFSPQAMIARPGSKMQAITLTPVESIAVQVMDTDGKPVANTPCWLTPMFLDWRSGPDAFLERLALRGYMEQAFTDSSGHVSFLTCYPNSGNSIKAYPEPPLAVGVASFCEAGQEVDIRCAFGFAVSGRFTDVETGEPIVGAFAIMTENHGQGSRTVSSQVTDENGFYRQEALPAGAAVFSIHAKAEGYAMQQQRVFTPRPLSSRELDFELYPAAGLVLKLRTTWGDPILDSLVQLRLGRNNLETAFQGTDEEGTVHFPAELQKETPYECLILIGSNFWALPDFLVHAGEEEIVVPGLSRVNKVVMPNDLPEGFDPVTLEWTSLANENQGVVLWEADQVSPLLPTGAGCLAANCADGRRLEMLASLQEGVHEQLDFLSHPAHLTFQWAGEEGALLSLRSNMAWDWFKLEEPISPGRVELDLWQGTFTLMVESESGSVSLPALRLDSGITDLGSLGWRDTSGVQGFVHDANHNPLVGVEVNLVSMDVGPSGLASTDANGAFAISGMSPGAYALQVTGGKAYGGSIHEVQLEVFLAPSTVLQDLDIQLEMNGGRYLEGNMTKQPPANAFAFSAADSQAQMVDVLPSGSFLLPQPLRSKWIGIGLQERGRVFLTMKQVDAGAESLLLDPPNIKRTIRILDEYGEPWANVRIYAYVAGASVGYFALPNLDGSLRLEVSTQAEANLQFRLPDGRAVVYALRELLMLETLVIPRVADSVQLVLVDDMGKAIPGVAAMHYGVGDVFYGNGNGQLELPISTAAKPYLLMAQGHLGMWDEGQNDHLLTLPTLYDGLSLWLPEDLLEREGDHALAWILVESIDLPQGAFAQGAYEIPVQRASIELPPLPAGPLKVQLFDSNGELHSEKTLTVEQGSLTLKY